MVLRALRYRGSTSSWRFERVRSRNFFGPGRVIAIFGDGKPRNRFIYLLHRYLEDCGTLAQDISFKLEPLSIMAAMLSLPPSSAQRLPMNRRPATIGGAPQVFRVFAGAQSTALAVQWSAGGRTRVYLQGRETFEYERNLDVPLVTFNDLRVEIYAPRQLARGNNSHLIRLMVVNRAGPAALEPA